MVAVKTNDAITARARFILVNAMRTCKHVRLRASNVMGIEYANDIRQGQRADNASSSNIASSVLGGDDDTVCDATLTNYTPPGQH